MERLRRRGGERLVGEPHRLCSACASLLSSGPLIEASLHPKPGAVTPCRGHGDKWFGDFAVHAAALTRALLEACLEAGLGGPEPVQAGLEAYGEALEALGIATNIGLGGALLLVPLAAAAPRLGGCGDPRALALEASRLARASGPGAAGAYYRLLSRLRPSHLGSYEGPVPDAARGDPGGAGLLDVLEAARWDHVHRELLEGYPLTLNALALIEGLTGSGAGLREAALEALLRLLAGAGDTLIAAKWGFKAMERAAAEARVALRLYEAGRLSLEGALEWLDGLWRPRRWNPGAVLDVLGASLGLYIASRATIQGLLGRL